MVVHEKFVFLHLQKSAGCFTREFLAKAFPGAQDRTDRRHWPLEERPAGKFVFGNIRNPWEWYVSWYSYRSDPFRGFIDRHADFRSLMLDLHSGENHGRLHDLDFDAIRREEIGLCTYYYKRLFRHVVPDFFCRVECLEQDLIAGLERSGLPLDDRQTNLLLGMQRVNTSEHGNSTSYYDEELIELVRKRDRLIIEKFGYEYPDAGLLSGTPSCRGASADC